MPDVSLDLQAISTTLSSQTALKLWFIASCKNLFNICAGVRFAKYSFGTAVSFGVSPRYLIINNQDPKSLLGSYCQLFQSGQIRIHQMNV